MAKFNRKISRVRRHTRIRKTLQGTEARPRLSVFRSLTNVYAQLSMITKGVTLVAASSLDERGKEAQKARRRLMSPNWWAL